MRGWTAEAAQKAVTATLAAAARLREIPLMHSATTALADTASTAAALAFPALSSAYATVAATAALATSTVRTKTPAVVLAAAARLTAAPEKVIFLQSAAFLTYFLVSETMMHGKLEEQRVAKAREVAAIRREIEEEFDLRADVEQRRLAQTRLARMAELHKKIDERGVISKVAEQAKEAQARQAAAEAEAARAQQELAAAASASAAETERVRARVTNLQKRLAEAVQAQSSTREHADLSTREAQRAHERLSKVEAELEVALARAQESDEIRKQIEAVSASNRAESVKAELLRRQLADARRASRAVEEAHQAAAAEATAAATASLREVEQLSHKLEQVERMLRLREADYRSELQATREAHAQRLSHIMRLIEDARSQAASAHAELAAAREREHSLRLSVKDSLAAAMALEAAAAAKAYESETATAAEKQAGALDGAPSARNRSLVHELEAQRAKAQEEAEALAKTAVLTERQAALARAEMEAVRASAEGAKGDAGADQRFELLQAANKRSEARYAISKRRSLLAADAAAAALVRYEQACLAEKDAVRGARANSTDGPASRVEVDAHTARVSAQAARRHSEELVEQLAKAREAVDAAQHDYDRVAQVEARLQAQLSQEAAASDQVKARQPAVRGLPAPGQPASVTFKGPPPSSGADKVPQHAAWAAIPSEALARGSSPLTDGDAAKKPSSFALAVPAHLAPPVAASDSARSSGQASTSKLAPPAAQPTIPPADKQPEQPTVPISEATRRPPRPPSNVRQSPLKPPPVKQLPLRPSGASRVPSFNPVAPLDVSPAADQIRTQFRMAFAGAGTPAWVRSTSEPSLNATALTDHGTKYGPRMRVLRLDLSVPAERLLVDFREASKVEAVYSKRTGERKDVVISFKLGTSMKAMRYRAEGLGCTLHPILEPMVHHNDVRMISWTRTQHAAEPAKKMTQA